jgi:hypothetical protein
MNLFAVTPTFQSALLAGWKTGATKVNGFMAPMHVQYSEEEAFHEPFFSQVLLCSSSNPSLRQKNEREDEGRGTRTNSLGRFMAPMRVQCWSSMLPMNLKVGR